MVNISHRAPSTEHLNCGQQNNSGTSGHRKVAFESRKQLSNLSTSFVQGDFSRLSRPVYNQADFRASLVRHAAKNTTDVFKVVNLPTTCNTLIIVIKLQQVCENHLQTSYKLSKELAASLWITIFDNELEASLLTTCN